MGGQRAAIPGSDVKHGDDACWSPAPCNMQVGVTIYIRPRDDTSSEELLSGRFQPAPQETTKAKFGATAQELNAVRAFAEEYGLRVTGENAAARTVHVEGTVQQMAAAFGVRIGILKSGEQIYVSYQGPLTVPAALENVVAAVLGLDRRPIAKAHQ